MQWVGSPTMVLSLGRQFKGLFSHMDIAYHHNIRSVNGMVDALAMQGLSNLLFGWDPCCSYQGVVGWEYSYSCTLPFLFGCCISSFLRVRLPFAHIIGKKGFTYATCKCYNHITMFVKIIGK